eukprot:6200385-Pleurochrysis_carterae.AAC.2
MDKRGLGAVIDAMEAEMMQPQQDVITEAKMQPQRRRGCIFHSRSPLDDVGDAATAVADSFYVVERRVLGEWRACEHLHAVA